MNTILGLIDLFNLEIYSIVDLEFSRFKKIWLSILTLPLTLAHLQSVNRKIHLIMRSD